MNNDNININLEALKDAYLYSVSLKNTISTNDFIDKVFTPVYDVPFFLKKDRIDLLYKATEFMVLLTSPSYTLSFLDTAEKLLDLFGESRELCTIVEKNHEFYAIDANHGILNFGQDFCDSTSLYSYARDVNKAGPFDLVYDKEKNLMYLQYNGEYVEGPFKPLYDKKKNLYVFSNNEWESNSPLKMVIFNDGTFLEIDRKNGNYIWSDFPSLYLPYAKDGSHSFEYVYDTHNGGIKSIEYTMNDIGYHISYDSNGRIKSEKQWNGNTDNTSDIKYHEDGTYSIEVCDEEYIYLYNVDPYNGTTSLIDEHPKETLFQE